MINQTISLNHRRSMIHLTPNTISQAEERERKAKAAAQAKAKAKAQKAAKQTKWTQDELSMLAKVLNLSNFLSVKTPLTYPAHLPSQAARKFPAGTGNRWQTVAAFITQQLHLDTPKTKEECIQKYNQIQAQLTNDKATTSAPVTRYV